MGILDDSYIDVADKAINAILKNIDSDGTVLNVSGGTGMGYDAEHYKNILIAPMAYGQSLTILALVEALQNDKKKHLKCILKLDVLMNMKSVTMNYGLK